MRFLQFKVGWRRLRKRFWEMEMEEEWGDDPKPNVKPFYTFAKTLDYNVDIPSSRRTHSFFIMFSKHSSPDIKLQDLITSPWGPAVRSSRCVRKWAHIPPQCPGILDASVLGPEHSSCFIPCIPPCSPRTHGSWQLILLECGLSYHTAS